MEVLVIVRKLMVEMDPSGLIGCQEKEKPFGRALCYSNVCAHLQFCSLESWYTYNIDIPFPKKNEEKVICYQLELGK